MTLEDTESAADALVGGMEKLPISERWQAAGPSGHTKNLVRPMQTSSARPTPPRGWDESARVGNNLPAQWT